MKNFLKAINKIDTRTKRFNNEHLLLSKGKLIFTNGVSVITYKLKDKEHLPDKLISRKILSIESKLNGEDIDFENIKNERIIHNQTHYDFISREIDKIEKLGNPKITSKINLSEISKNITHLTVQNETDAREYIKGVHFGESHCKATDGHSAIIQKMDDGYKPLNETIPFEIMRTTECFNVKGDWELYKLPGVEKNNWETELPSRCIAYHYNDGNEIEIIFKPIDGNHPDFKRIMLCTQQDVEMQCDKKKLVVDKNLLQKLRSLPQDEAIYVDGNSILSETGFKFDIESDIEQVYIRAGSFNIALSTVPNAFVYQPKAKDDRFKLYFMNEDTIMVTMYSYKFNH